MSVHTHNYIRRLRILSIASLVSIGILTIIGSLVAQYLVHEQSGSAHIVNLAGRQRMLSQRITKSVLAIERSRYFYPDTSQFHFVHELETSFLEWKKVHHGLQYGSREHGLPSADNSIEIQRLFATITYCFNGVDSAVTQLLDLLHTSEPATDGETVGRGVERQKKRFQELTSELLMNQQKFLVGMDAITFQYDKESAARILDIQRTLQIVVVIIVLAIFMEALLVFRPAIRKLGVVVNQLAQSQKLSDRSPSMSLKVRQ